MEFKAVEETYEPSYPTQEENKNVLVKIVVGCKKIGTYFLLLSLMISQCLAEEIPDYAFGGLVVDVPSQEEIFKVTVVEILWNVLWIILYGGMIFLVVCAVKKYRKKKNESIDKESKK